MAQNYDREYNDETDKLYWMQFVKCYLSNLSLFFIKIFVTIILYHMINISKHVISTLKSHYYLTCGSSPSVIKKFKQKQMFSV